MLIYNVYIYLHHILCRCLLQSTYSPYDSARLMILIAERATILVEIGSEDWPIILLFGPFECRVEHFLPFIFRISRSCEGAVA